MPYSPSLATFEKDCGPDKERRLLFSLPSANPGRPWRLLSLPVLQETSPFPVDAGLGLPPPQPPSVPAGLQYTRQGSALCSGRGAHPRGAGLSPRVGFGVVRAGWSVPGTWDRCGGSGRDWAGGEGREDPRAADGGGVVAGQGLILDGALGARREAVAARCWA